MGLDTHPAPAWAGHATWTVLDTAFGTAEQFLTLWARWQSDPQRPAMLHYVGLLELDAAQTLAASLSAQPWPVQLQARAQALAQACYGLHAGFHRITLAQGQLSLTLCVGPVQELLGELQLQAHTLWVHHPELQPAAWHAKALAKLCALGASLSLQAPATDATTLAAHFTPAGFVDITPGATPHTPWHMRWAPHWNTARSRHSTCMAQTPGRCVVIGAGLAGASVAHALALRGWQITVLDAQAQCAAGASALPVGLVAPHASADDSPRSRLSRAGLRLMVAHAQQHLRAGEDWSPSGVLEIREGPALPPSDPHTAMGAWRESATALQHAPWAQGLDAQRLAHSVWHLPAAWLRPARMVAAWLAHPRITFQGHSPVQRLERQGTGWQVWGEDGLLAECEVVVVANALASAALLADPSVAPHVQAGLGPALQALHGMQGMVSMGTHADLSPHDVATKLPPYPVNGLGSLVPRLPGASPHEASQWVCGASFLPLESAMSVTEQHASNWQRLAGLLPAAAQCLQTAFQQGTVQHWQGTRCVTHDRLPLVGPLDTGATPSLWISAGMGSRGLTFAALCAELLAAQLCGEPLPVPQSLARSLLVQRALRQRIKPFAARSRPAGE